MSLRVWLPFADGTLKQQGLNNASATVGGTVNLTNAGKLGKCATIGTAAGGITLPASTMTSFTECSVAFWIKIISWNTSYATFFQAGLGSTPWNNYIFGILRNNQNSNLCFTLTNSNSSSSQASYITSNLNTGQWYHLVFTYKAGTICTYIDGVLDKTYNTSYIPNFAGITNISIGRSTNNSNYQTNCNLNDFRIYDHCLSPMEVKELSKGLVLHYPLNRQGFGQENLAHNTYNLTPFSTNEVEFKAYDVGLLDVSNGEQITISFDLDMTVATGGSGYLQIYNTNYPGPHQIATGNALAERTLVAGQDIHERISYTTTMTTRSSPSYSTDRIEFYSNYSTENEIQISNIKIERGSKATPWCPNSSDALATTMGLNGTTEYDCSGFCNNGTRNTNTTYSSNTPKYNVSTFFGGVDTPKATLNDSTILTALTNCSVAWWERCTTTGNTLIFSGQTQYYYIGAGNSNDPLYDYNIGTSGIILYKDGMAVNTSYSGSRVNHSGTYHIKDEWHHYVLTGINLSTWTTFKINSYSSWPTNAYLSDVRIYATALSADDVRSLYQNSAYIDSSGNVYGAIHSEV